MARTASDKGGRPVTSREYKVMVDGGPFVQPGEALDELRADLADLARSLDSRGVSFSGKFDLKDPKERSIIFIDTPDFTLRDNDLLLRQRVTLKSGKTEYTLKCRTPDRYIAAGKDLRATRKPDEAKFEEDVGVPLVPRFSQSASLDFEQGDKWAAKPPSTLAEAARLYPALLAVKWNDEVCRPETVLKPVNGLQAFERVFTGPVLGFPGGKGQRGPTPATVALILWSKGARGRVLAAELSFRYQDPKERFPLETAQAAKEFFAGLQRMDWARPDALTKTQYLYRG
jgi:hypothetical protein